MWRRKRKGDKLRGKTTTGDVGRAPAGCGFSAFRTALSRPSKRFGRTPGRHSLPRSSGMSAPTRKKIITLAPLHSSCFFFCEDSCQQPNVRLAISYFIAIARITGHFLSRRIRSSHSVLEQLLLVICVTGHMPAEGGKNCKQLAEMLTY